MDLQEIIKKLNQFAKLLSKHFVLKKLILFGSYANGTAHAHSDVDVAVIVEKNEMNFFQYAPLLWNLAGKIDALIEPILFEEGSEDTSGFLNHISKTGISVYDSQS